MVLSKNDEFIIGERWYQDISVSPFGDESKIFIVPYTPSRKYPEEIRTRDYRFHLGIEQKQICPNCKSLILVIATHPYKFEHLQKAWIAAIRITVKTTIKKKQIKDLEEIIRETQKLINELKQSDFSNIFEYQPKKKISIGDCL